MSRVDDIELDVGRIKGNQSAQVWADSKANEHGIGQVVNSSYLESKTKSAGAFTVEINT